MNKIWLLIAMIFILSCTQKEKKKEINWKQVDKQLIRVNKFLVKEDRQKIINYIERHNWNMKESSTGYWYEIYEHGKGDSARNGQVVVIDYKVWLLDGTLCYSSDSLGPKTFKIGRSDVEPGLNQAIQKMRVGDKARFIFPPHLAWGLVGDRNKIKGRQIIVYDVKLLKIIKPKN